jgi:CheY-like chemotaxis protein
VRAVLSAGTAWGRRLWRAGAAVGLAGSVEVAGLTRSIEVTGITGTTEAPQAAGAEEVSSAEPRMSRTGRHEPVVLVAGASLHQRIRIGGRLRRSGFYVRTVPDGPSALAHALECPPAAVVMEWPMPGSGGTDVCVRLRQHPTLRRLPVVLLAAGGEQVAEGLRAGADEVLTRPFEPAALVGFLERNLAWASNGPT